MRLALFPSKEVIMEERLQKILSQSGLCSRRQAEEYLKAGRIAVNGAVAGLGDKADPEKDVVTLDGEPLTAPEKKTYLMLHKPRGYVTTLSDERGRKTVADLVKDCGQRVWPVGRLDMDSEGLLILTDDGDLTNHLSHPSHMVEKEYYAWVEGDALLALPILSKPMEVEGEKFRAAKVRILSDEGGRAKLSVIIREGKNRQVRRMCAFAGLSVKRLRRVREGDLMLDPKLPTGKWRHLTAQEVALLRKG